MYTEEDLRATLDALESEAPDTAGVLAALSLARRRRTVRRRVVGVVATAVVAAVVAGGSMLVGNLATPSGLDTGTPPATRNPLRYPFAVDESTDLRVSYGASRFAGAATARISGTGQISGTGPVLAYEYPYPYLLEVIEAGRWAPAEGQLGEPVQVNGMTGFYRADFQYKYNEEGTTGVPGVTWEYAPDSWAVLRYQPTEPTDVPPADVRESLLRIAAAVRFDRTTPVRLPFQVGYLPAGLRPAEDFPADFSAGMDKEIAMVTLVGGADELNIRLVKIGDPASALGVVNVYEMNENHKFVTVNLGQFGLLLSGQGFSADEVKKVAESITPATDLEDPHTWFDADKALPLG